MFSFHNNNSAKTTRRLSPATVVAATVACVALALPAAASAGHAPPTITAGPANLSAISSTTAIFSFTTPAPPAFNVQGHECRIDASAYAACTSPKAFLGLSQGWHTFRVRSWRCFALSCALTLHYSADSLRVFKVDTIDPQTTILTGPSGLTNDNTPTFTFSSNEAGVDFRCGLDPDAPGLWIYVLCTAPKTYGALPDGGYTFRVKARDDAGNEDPTPASRHFVVDTIAPTVAFTAGSAEAATVTTPDVTFEFTVSEAGSTTECAIDGGAYAACTSPLALTGLANGAHSVAVRATDPAGNTGPSSTRSFTVAIPTPATPPPPAQPTQPAATTTAKGCAAKKSRSARKRCLRRQAIKRCRKASTTRQARRRCVRKANRRYR